MVVSSDVATQQLFPTILNQQARPRMEIKVGEGLMQQKKKMFSTTTYLTFKIEVPQFGWEVRRKDEDFNLLFDYLKKVNPHILIPPISACKLKKKFE